MKRAITLCILCVLTFRQATAGSIEFGDILVADVAGAFGGVSSIIQVDPTTGAQTTISSGGHFDLPRSIAIAEDGTIYVADDGLIAVIRVDPTIPDDGLGTNQTVVSSGGIFRSPSEIAIDANGDIVLADRDALGGPGAIIQVDPVSGAQTIVSSGGDFHNPFGIAIASNGDIFVADASAYVDSKGGVIRVDPVTGDQSTVSSGGFFELPNNIAIDANSDLLVVDQFAFNFQDAIFRIDPTIPDDGLGGNQSVVSTGGIFSGISGLALEPNGDIVVADASVDRITRVDPVTGAQTIVSSGGLLDAPVAVAVWEIPEPTTLTLASLGLAGLSAFRPRRRRGSIKSGF